MYWPDKISNEDLYERCRTRPISDRIIQLRWNLFGHALRRDSDIPAQTSMTEYLNNRGPKYLGRTPTSLPTTLNQDLRNLTKTTSADPQPVIQRQPPKLTDHRDLEKLKEITNNRDEWRQVTKHIYRGYHKTRYPETNDHN